MIRILARRGPLDGLESIGEGELGDGSGFDLIWMDIGGLRETSETEMLGRLGVDVDLMSKAGAMPGLTEDGKALYMTIVAPETGEQGRLEIDQIDVGLTRNIVVTSHDDPVLAIDRLWATETLGALELKTPAVLASALAHAATRQMIPLIDELEFRVDGLEDLAFAADPQTLGEIHVLRRELITLRRIATRQRDASSEASNSSHIAVGTSGRESFSRTADEAARIVDSLETSRSMLGSALETYRGAVADETNEIVRLLTVFSAILLPLTLITGIFGMNFISMPSTDEPWGFWVWIGVMVVTAVGLWTFFVRKGFIGGSLLRDLPKSVGLGIVTVGTAPVRALASGVTSTVKYLDPRRESEDNPGAASSTAQTA